MMNSQLGVFEGLWFVVSNWLNSQNKLIFHLQAIKEIVEKTHQRTKNSGFMRKFSVTATIKLKP